MILTLKLTRLYLFLTLSSIAWLIPYGALQAQDAVSLSVTPPLFQISAEPEQIWQSSIKVINTNAFPLTVYANPVNFMPIGEGGQGRFTPILATETEGQTLAEWIEVSNQPFVIDPESSITIPFVVNLPETVPPGGHFAAILIGTQPPAATEALAIRTSQVVSSLFFLTVAGDIVERGSIREFSVANSFTDEPRANFLLRFQNEGNVHVRPQGDIKVFNMWGKERGLIPINQQSQYGNVLPSTIRKFEFSWAGEPSLSDVGRYTAEVTLGYGQESWRTVTRTVSFWVIPVRLTLVSLVIIGLLMFLVRWAIKSYIRNMLWQAGIDPDERRRARESGAVVMHKKLEAVQAPVAAAPAEEKTRRSVPLQWLRFVNTHMYFFVGIPSGIALMVIFFWYLSGALAPQKSFEATVTQGDNEVEINSEEIRREQTAPATTSPSMVEQPYAINIINVSGASGVGADVSVVLEEAGYRIDGLELELGRKQRNTVIIAPPERTAEAQALSELLGNPLVSLSEALAETEQTMSTINIFIGQDQE